METLNILSPAYDIVPSKIYPLEQGNSQQFFDVALTVNGKQRNIRKKDFLKMAVDVGLATHLDRFVNAIKEKEGVLFTLIDESHVEEGFKKDWKEYIKDKLDLLTI